MRTSLSVPLVRGFSITLLALAWVVASAAYRPHGHDTYRHANACGEADETMVEFAHGNATQIASNPDSGHIEKRARHGLITWPEDSVLVTTDSIVCHHIDSLIGVWYASPEGIASGAIRNEERWGPLLVLVRLNSGRYYVWPGITTTDEWAYNFIVDSVGGGVEYFQTPF
jgi:hypothetical protein